MVNWTRVLIGVVGAALAVVGVAAAMFIPGIGSTIGGALIGGGVSMLMTAITSKNPTWGEAGMAFLTGAIGGLVSAGFSSIATGLVRSVGANLLARLAVSFVARVGAGALATYVTNGICNKLKGKAFNENWKRAVASGAIAGLISFGVEAFSICSSTQYAQQLIEGFDEGTSRLRKCYNDAGTFLTNYVPSVVRTVVVDMVVGAGQSILYELLTTGKIDWKVVATGALICGGLSLARAGMAYKRGQRNEKMVKKALDEHEHGGTRPDENANEQADPNTKNSKPANEKVAKKPGTTAIVRDDKSGKEYRGESYQKRASRYKNTSGADTSKEGVAAATKVDGDKLPGNYKMRTLDTDGQNVGMTPSEARNTLGENADISQRACAEADAAQHITPDRGIKDLSDTTAVTINTNKKGKTRFQPACEEACSSNPHTNICNPRELANHILDRQGHMGTQQAPLLPKFNGKKDKKDEPRSDSSSSSAAATSATAYAHTSGHVPGLVHRGRPSGSSEVSPTNAFSWAPATFSAHNHRKKSQRSSQRLRSVSESDEEDVYCSIMPSMDEDIDSSNAIYPTSSSSSKNFVPVTEDSESLPLMANASDCFSSESEEILYVQDLKQKERERKKSMKDEFLASHPPINREEYVQSSSAGVGARVGGSSAQSSSRYECYNIDVISGVAKKGKDKVASAARAIKDMAVGREKEAKIPEIVQIVGWSEHHNEYRMIKETKWPKLPEKLRLVAVAGVHGSGRTTLLHSLIYQYGYCIPKAQAVVTMLRVGINLYILPDANIAFLDVCDSMDSTGQTQKDAPALGSVLLETFAYLCCDHVVYSMTLDNGQADMSVQDIHNWIRKRLNMLLVAGYELESMRGGAKNASMILRTNRPSPAVLGTISQVERLLERRPGSEKSFEGLSEAEKQNLAFDVSHNVQVRRLERVHVNGKSANEDDEYKDQLDSIMKRINETTGYHYAMANDSMAAKNANAERFTVEGGMIAVWNELTCSESIEKAIISAANSAQADQSDSKTADEAKKFWNNLSSFQQKLGDHSLNYRITSLIKEFERKVEEAKRGKKDSSRIYLEYSAQVAVTVLSGSLDLDNVSLKEEGIRSGLHGLSYLLNASDDSNVMDAFFLRFAIVDYALLEVLNHEDIYKYYSNCWYILYNAASCGFRLRLLTFPLCENAVKVLRYLGQKELVGDNLRLYKNVLNVLARLMNPEVDLNGLQGAGGVSEKTDGIRLSMKDLRFTLLEMEYGISEKVRALVEQAYDNPQSASDSNEKALELPGEWFDEFACDMYKTKFDMLDSREKNMFMENIHVVIHKEVAMRFARDLIERGLVDELFLPSPDMREEEARARGHFIAQLLDLAAKDDALFMAVMSTTRIVPRLNECMRTANLHDSLLSVVLKCFLWLMHAEAHRDSVTVSGALVDIEPIVRDSKKKDRVHDLLEVERRERREKQIKRYGFVALHCLDNKFLNSVCRRLITHATIDKRNQENILNFFERLHCVAIEEVDRKQFYDEIYRNRGELFASVAKIMVESAESLSPDRNNDSLRVIHQGCHLLNNLMFCYKNENFDMPLLYKSEESDRDARDPRSMASFVVLGGALENIFRHFILKKKSYMKKDSFSSALYSFTSLLLNVQATSGITHAEVKAFVALDQSAQNVYAELSDVTEDFNEARIVCGTKHLAELDPEQYVRAVSRAAFILHNTAPAEITYTVAHRSIQSCVGEVINGAKSSLEVQEREKQDRQRAKTKSQQRMIGGGDSRTEPSTLLDRLDEATPSSSEFRNETTPRSSQEITTRLACDGIYMVCVPLNQKFPKAQVGNARFHEDIDLPVALALTILFNNDLNDSNDRRIDHLMRHLKKVLEIENPLFMKLANDNVKDLLKLKHIRRVLEDCGHQWTRKEGEEGIFSTVLTTECRELISELLAWMTNLRAEPVRKLYSTFELCKSSVHQVGRDAFFNELLPPAFFSRNQEELSSCTIQQLNEMRTRGHELKPADACSHVLVRVELNDGRMVQAVFSDFAVFETVKQQLIEDGFLDPEHDHLGLPNSMNLSNTIVSSSKFALYMEIMKR